MEEAAPALKDVYILQKEQDEFCCTRKKKFENRVNISID